jgi:hypothetical protein
MPETDLANLKKLERDCLHNAGNVAETWGLFSNHDELFGGSGYLRKHLRTGMFMPDGQPAQNQRNRYP